MISVPDGQAFGSHLVVCFWPQPLVKVQSRGHLGPKSSEASLWLPHIACWEESSLPHQLFAGDLVASLWGSSQSKWSRSERAHGLCCNLIVEEISITSATFCWSQMSTGVTQKRLQKGVNAWLRNHSGVVLEAGCPILGAVNSYWMFWTCKWCSYLRFRYVTLLWRMRCRGQDLSHGNTVGI